MNHRRKLRWSLATVLMLAAAVSTVIRHSGDGSTATNRKAPTPQAGIVSGPRSGNPAGAAVNDSFKTKTKNRPGEAGPARAMKVAMKPDAVKGMLGENMWRFSIKMYSGHELDATLEASIRRGRDEQISRTLGLLGASTEECGAVISALDQANKDLQAAERKQIKVVSASGTGVTLDLSGMTKPAAEIIARTRESVRSALPPNIGELTVEAIDWETLYFNGAADPMPVNQAASTDGTDSSRANFTIERSDGKITTHFTNGSSTTKGEIPADFPDDGTPLPADELFGERWAPYLKGVMLSPVDIQ